MARQKFIHSDGDHLTYLEVFNAYKQFGVNNIQWCQQNYLNYKALKQADDIVQQIQQIFTKLNLQLLDCPEDIQSHFKKHDYKSYENIKRSLL